MATAATHLRLAWENPGEVAASATRAALALLPPPPPMAPATRVALGRRLDLALAIESHVAGRDGLSDDEFVHLFALGRWPGAARR